MCKSNRPFIPSNGYSEFISLYSFARMNGWLELRMITLPYSKVYWGYFRRIVFGNSLPKHNKLSSFSYSVVIFSSRFSTYRLVIMLNLPISNVWFSPVYIMCDTHDRNVPGSPPTSGCFSVEIYAVIYLVSKGLMICQISMVVCT